MNECGSLTGSVFPVWLPRLWSFRGGRPSTGGFSVRSAELFGEVMLKAVGQAGHCLSYASEDGSGNGRSKRMTCLDSEEDPVSLGCNIEGKTNENKGYSLWVEFSEVCNYF